MSTFLIQCNGWLSKNMFIVVLSALVLGFLTTIIDSPSLRQTVVVLFAYMTFVTALSTSFKDFLKVLRTPWIPLWVLILVHFVTPLTAWAVGMIFYPNDPDIRLGYLIGASIPIGVTSIIWTSLVKGDLAISLVAVTLDTFVFPLVLPLFFHMLIGETIDINYGNMVIDLMFMVTVPSIVGMLLHDFTNGKVANFATSVGGVTSKLALFVVILINSAVVMPQIIWDISILKTLLVTFFIVSAGFFVGYLGSFVLKERTREIILTMIYNVGIRNNACGLVIALTYFPPRVAIPMTLSILYQQPLATIVSYLYKRLKTA
jgi:predicted Na+-dependent transporter